MQLEIGADFGFYKQFTTQDYRDYYAQTGNTFEIVRGTNLFVDALYRHAHAPRTSPDNIYAAAEPLVYDLLSGTLGVERNLGVLSLRADVKADELTYQNSESVGGGTIDNSDQDRHTLDAGIQFGYSPFQESMAYIDARVKDVQYVDSTSEGGPNRDNTGFTIMLGAKKNLSDLWVANAYIGYAPRFFATDSLEDITGQQALILGGELLWNPTALTSVIGNVDRRTYETTQAGASALVNTLLSMRVEHKLLRSLLLDAEAGVDYGDYYGSSREDRSYRVGVGAEYFLTRIFSLRTAYSYGQRNSTEAGLSYDQQLASLQLRINF